MRYEVRLSRLLRRRLLIRDDFRTRGNDNRLLAVLVLHCQLLAVGTGDLIGHRRVRMRSILSDSH